MILDTNAVSDFADANQGLLGCLQQSADDIHLPAIVLCEYRYGLKSSRLGAAFGSAPDRLLFIGLSSERYGQHTYLCYSDRHVDAEVFEWSLVGWFFESMRSNACISAV